MQLITGIFKPEYLYRPKQLLRRVFGPKSSGFVSSLLPWGKSIRVSSDDNVGGQITTLGVYDLVVTETLWRLCEAGEVALDVGANIGYTTFVMAERLKHGRIECFEPHPVIFEELQTNIASLKSQGAQTTVNANAMALGPSQGSFPLYVPKDFKYHRGESSLTAPTHLDHDATPFHVPVVSLDSLPVSKEQIGVMKIDVEGFEIEVLKGATEAFEEHRIRDVVFEEHRPYPTDVTKFFEDHGYTVFRLERKFSGLLLLAPSNNEHNTHWTATNFLATLKPDRAKELLTKSGWMCLSGAS